MSSDSLIQVITTTETAEEAGRIAQELLHRRLVACVQVIGPITSRYWWKGRRETAQEWQCIAKTTAGLYSKVEAAIQTFHSYETPEVIALPIVQASAGYVKWLTEAIRVGD